MTKFEVRESVFGNRITDADLACQTLMVLETNSLTKVYDIWEVLKSQRQRDVRMIKLPDNDVSAFMLMKTEMSEQAQHGKTQSEESHKNPRCLGTFRYGH